MRLCAYVRTYVHALKVLRPGSDVHCSSAASGGGSPKGLFSCVWGGGVGAPLGGVADAGALVLARFQRNLADLEFPC